MPYFKRKPYAEMMADTARPDVAPTARPGPDPAPQSIVELADQVLRDNGTAIPVAGPFRLNGGVRPGETSDIVLTFENLARDSASALRLTASDLHGPDGHVIAADNVQVLPSMLQIPQNGETDAIVRVFAPMNAPAGTYVGMIKGVGEDALDSAIEVVVNR